MRKTANQTAQRCCGTNANAQGAKPYFVSGEYTGTVAAMSH
jgi:hypothetical protein